MAGVNLTSLAKYGEITGMFRNFVRTKGADGVERLFKKMPGDLKPMLLRSRKTFKFNDRLDFAPSTSNRTNLQDVLVRRSLTTDFMNNPRGVREVDHLLYTLRDGRTAATQTFNHYIPNQEVLRLGTDFNIASGARNYTSFGTYNNYLGHEQIKSGHSVLNGISHKLNI